MIKIENLVDDSTKEDKILETRKWIPFYFSNYKRIDIPLNNFDFFKDKSDTKNRITLNYIDHKMIVTDSKIKNERLFSFEKKYKQIWGVENFNIDRES
ncbi:MAG: hypothetical protein Q8Q04_03455 [archaeon]|nr:hypothetical protein [archaeon]